MEVDMESEKAVGESVGVSGGVTHTQTPGTLSYVRLNAHVRNGGLVGSVVGTELTRSIKQQVLCEVSFVLMLLVGIVTSSMPFCLMLLCKRWRRRLPAGIHTHVRIWRSGGICCGTCCTGQLIRSMKQEQHHWNVVVFQCFCVIVTSMMMFLLHGADQLVNASRALGISSRKPVPA